MAQIIRYCKTEEEHHEENAFDCSRPGIFGNPYTHIKGKKTLASVVVKDREEAIRMFDPYFDTVMSGEDSFSAAFREAFEEMYRMYKKHGVVYLGCYCKRNETCHCDVIRKKLMERSLRDRIDEIRRIRDERQ